MYGRGLTPMPPPPLLRTILPRPTQRPPRSLQLSLRPSSTTTYSASPSSCTPPDPPPAPTPTPKRSKVRPWIWAFTFGLLGYTVGKLGIRTLLPPAYPTPGSAEDTALLKQLERKINDLMIVKELRGAAMPVNAVKAIQRGDGPDHIPNGSGAVDGDPRNPRPLALLQSKQKETVSTYSMVDGVGYSGSYSPWIELPDPLHLASWTGPEHAKRLLSKMTGFGGLGVSRGFWDPTKREVVLVLWIGGALAGWPGVAHGGALATVLMEGAALARALCSGSGSRAEVRDLVKERGGEGGDEKEVGRLGMTYLKPTTANDFYILRAKVAESERELPKPELSKPAAEDLARRTALEHEEGMKVNCSLEKLDGTICVKATTTWPAEHSVVGKAVKVVKKKLKT